MSEHWEPESWHKSPDQMQSEARSMNHAAHEHAAACASKHDNPPTNPNLRPF
jgi:hypothetical protein